MNHLGSWRFFQLIGWKPGCLRLPPLDDVTRCERGARGHQRAHIEGRRGRTRGRKTHEVALLALLAASGRELDRHGRDLEELAQAVGAGAEHLQVVDQIVSVERRQAGRRERERRTHGRPNQLEEVVLEGLALHPREVGLADVAAPLALEPVEVRQARLGEGRELVDALAQVGDAVVGVQVDKVLELAVDDPLDGAVAVLELDAEDGVLVVEWVDRVGDAQLCATRRKSGWGRGSVRALDDDDDDERESEQSDALR